MTNLSLMTCCGSSPHRWAFRFTIFDFRRFLSCRVRATKAPLTRAAENAEAAECAEEGTQAMAKVRGEVIGIALVALRSGTRYSESSSVKLCGVREHLGRYGGLKLKKEKTKAVFIDARNEGSSLRLRALLSGLSGLGALGGSRSDALKGILIRPTDVFFRRPEAIKRLLRGPPEEGRRTTCVALSSDGVLGAANGKPVTSPERWPAAAGGPSRR